MLFLLSTVRVVEQDNGAKVHFSLINYPLLFPEAIRKHTHIYTHKYTRITLITVMYTLTNTQEFGF